MMKTKTFYLIRPVQFFSSHFEELDNDVNKFLKENVEIKEFKIQDQINIVKV